MMNNQVQVQYKKSGLINFNHFHHLVKETLPEWAELKIQSINDMKTEFSTGSDAYVNGIRVISSFYDEEYEFIFIHDGYFSDDGYFYVEAIKPPQKSMIKWDALPILGTEDHSKKPGEKKLPSVVKTLHDIDGLIRNIKDYEINQYGYDTADISKHVCQNYGLSSSENKWVKQFSN